MATLTHPKVNNVTAWTQADLDAQIALGNYAPGTLLNDITLSTDWNSNHTLSGTSGSVLFIDATNNLAEDNANFNYSSTTNLLKIAHSALATTAADAILLQNPTAAALGAQQVSPSLHLSGQAWGTTLGTSQDTSFYFNLLPVQSTTPTANLQFQSSIAGGALATRLTLTSSGTLIGAGAATTSVVYQSNATIANANLAVVGTGGSTSTAAQYIFGGASTITYRIGMRGGTTSVPATGTAAAGLVLATQDISLPAGGNVLLAAQQVINPLTVTVGTGTVTNTASLYINGVSTATVSGGNYALWSTAGINRLDGQLQLSITTVSADTTLDKTHYTVLVDATSASKTITLPAAASNARAIYNIKKIDASANTVTIDANASELIDGALTKVISTQWSSVTIQCNGTAWYIL